MVAAEETAATSKPTVEAAAVHPKNNHLSSTIPSQISTRLSPTLMANNDNLIQVLAAFARAAADDMTVQRQQHNPPFLINGLVKWEQVAVMTATVTEDILGFITRNRQLKQLGVSARPDVAPNRQPRTKTPHQDLTATLKDLGDRMMVEFSATL